ncbi:GNAT family N-acetyltransferase [Streptomyces lydicus]|uniref:GNAT family N-acetyltransferase n=1 Tax=Streptomyces lydicus TaxID=47763 RepID=UPI0037B12484
MRTRHGEAVLLRPVTAEDVPAPMPMFHDAVTTRLTGGHDDGEPDEAQLRAWYGTRGGQDGRLDPAVVERATGRVVGEAVLHDWDGDDASCGFRIRLVPGTFGPGLGTEATRLIVG